MQRTLNMIILRTIRYNDRNSIVSAYSRELGRVSFLSPSGSSREAVRRRALLMPLSCVVCEATITTGRELLTVRDVSRPGGFDFSDNPLKSVTALFIADFLNAILRESQPDESMFEFISEAVGRLGDIKGGAELANYHIAFLVGLQKHLGIYPDFSTYRRGRVFDMIDGVCRATPPLHGKYLNREETAFAFLFSRMTMRNMGYFRLNREQRNRALDVILDFYSIHLDNIRDLQSLEVVRSLF